MEREVIEHRVRLEMAETMAETDRLRADVLEVIDMFEYSGSDEEY